MHVNNPPDALARAFLSITDTLGFKRHPTHIGGSTLDLVLTRGVDISQLVVSPYTSALSDHILLTFQVVVSCACDDQQATFSCRRITPETITAMADKLSSGGMSYPHPPSLAVQSLRKTRLYRAELRAAERKWKRSDCPNDLSHYLFLLSDFTSSVSTTKSAFYRTKINSSASNPRKLFSLFSSLLNPPSPPPPSCLTADDFVTYFTQKVKDISSSFIPASILPPPIPHVSSDIL